MESWRPIAGCERYKISDHGRVWSDKDRKIVKLTTTSTGYVHVYVGVNKLVHQLVLEAFVEPRPTPTAEVRHLDGDPTNNRPENLAWGTRLENAADKREHGTHNNTQRQTCRRRGHDLVAPNLDPWTLKNVGRRKCWSCHWAFNNVVKQRRWARHYDRDMLADLLYAHLMEGATDPRGDWRKWEAARLAAPLEAEVRNGRVHTRSPRAETQLLSLVSPGEVFSPAELRQLTAAAGREMDRSTVQHVLLRATKAGRLERVARGRYRLTALDRTADHAA